MYRFASSLLASAVLVFLGTSLLAAIGDPRIYPPPKHIYTLPHPPKVIATVVAHGHTHDGSAFAVHGL